MPRVGGQRLYKKAWWGEREEKREGQDKSVRGRKWPGQRIFIRLRDIKPSHQIESNLLLRIDDNKKRM